MNFLEIQIRKEWLSEKDSHFFHLFEKNIKNIVSDLNLDFKTIIYPAITNAGKECIAYTFSKYPLYGNIYRIGYNSGTPCNGYDDKLMYHSAMHEVCHILIARGPRSFRTRIITFLCSAVNIAIKNGNKHVFLDMEYMQDNFLLQRDLSFSQQDRMAAGEEVVCELASHEKSPVKNIVFSMILNGRIDREDYIDILNILLK